MLPISIKHPDGVIYHFCSASNFGSCNGHRLIFSKLNTSAASAFINKFKNSELLRIRRLLTKDQLKHLPLRKSIGNALSGAKLQVYEDRQVTKADVGELAKVRQEIKFILSQLLNEEKLETQRIEQQHQKRNVLEKVLIYKQEFDKGLSDAAVSLLTWAKEVADVVSPTENLKRVLDAAWETYNSNSKNWQQTFADQLKAANYKELIEALGFDPSKLSKDQIVELFETAKLIWDDKDTQEILLDFIKQYAAAQHSTEWANMAGSAAFDVILTALLAIFTGGIGVAASIGSKARLLGPLKRLGEKCIGLAKLLKKIKKPAVKRKKTKVGGSRKENNGSSTSQVENKKSNKADNDSNKPDNDPKNTPAPSKKEIELAKSEGSSPEQLSARDKVARHHMENNGFTDSQIDTALGSPNGAVVGGVDLNKPVEVVKFPPPDIMSQYVKSHGKPGNWFDPAGGQSPDSLGINGETRILKEFKVPEGAGIKSTAAPALDDWTVKGTPVQTNGGGIQLFVNDNVKRNSIGV